MLTADRERHWIIPLHYPLDRSGGIESLTRRMAKGFLDSGHRVTFLSLEENWDAGIAHKYPKLSEVQLVNSPIISGISSASLSHTKSIISAARLLRRFRPTDIFICDKRGLVYSPLILASRVFRSCRVLVHFPGPPPLPWRPEQLQRLPRMKRLIGCHARRKFFYSLGARAVSHAIYNNDEEMKVWKSGFGLDGSAHRTYLPPMDLGMFYPQIEDMEGESDSFTFGTTGRLTIDKSKGVDVLLDAFSIVVQQLEDKRPLLLIVGDGPEKSNLVRQARMANIDDSVKFVGAQSDVAAFLRKMDVFVSASRVESLGLAILEAQACGVPVIVTDLPGPRLVVGDGEAGTVVKVGSVGELASAMLDLARDKSKRHRFKERALEIVRRCDQSYAIAELLEWMKGTARVQH
jgi:glycosyltransferase involved in cell wall biosynthesis